MNAGVIEAVLRLRDEFSVQLKSATAKLDDFGASAGKAGLALTAGLSVPLGMLAHNAIQAAGSFEQVDMAFTQFLGSGEAAADFLNEMRDFAASTPFQFDDLVDSSKRMLALGFSAQQVKPMLTAIGDAVAGIGGGREVLNGVTIALGQMQAKGKVAAQEMNQLAERGIPAWQMLAKSIGVSIPEAMKMAEGGAISAAQAIPAILQGMNEKFGGMMDKQSQTLLGKWSTFKDEIGFALRDIGMALLPIATALIDFLKTAIPYVQALVTWFTQLPEPVRLAAVAFAALLAAIGPVLLGISGFSLGLSAVIAAGPILIPMLGVLAGAALALGAAWVAGGQSIEGVIKMLYNGLGNLVDAASVAIGVMTSSVMKGLALLGKLPGAAGAPFREAYVALREFNLNLQSTGANLRKEGENMASGATKIQTELKKATDTAAALADVFKNGVPPAGKLTEDQIEALQKALAQESQAATQAAREHYMLGQSMAQNVAEAQLFNAAVDKARAELEKVSAQGEMWRVAQQGIYEQTLKNADAFIKNGGTLDGLRAKLEGMGLTESELASIMDHAKVKLEQQTAAMEKAKAATVNWGATISGAVKNLPQVILAAIQGGGKVGEAIGASLGKDLGTGLGKNLEGAMKGLASKVGGGLGKAIGGLAGPLGGLVAPLLTSVGSKIGGLIGGLFKNKAKEQLKEARAVMEDFVKGQGGLESLKKKAEEAGVSLEKMFKAKNKEAMLKAIDEVKGKLETWDEAHEKLQAAVDKYGLTIEELGPKFAAQKLNEMAGGLLEDYELLKASGADLVAVHTKMGPAVQDYINQAIAAGQSVPQAMRPMIEAMIQQGVLLDENGQAFTSVEDAGITFAQTMDEKFSSLIDRIGELVAALTGVGNVSIPPVTIPYRYQQQGPGPDGDNRNQDGDNLPGFASGSGGFRNFGSGTLAVLHGKERVQTEAQARAEQADVGASLEAAVARQTRELAKVFRDAMLKGGA